MKSRSRTGRRRAAAVQALAVFAAIIVFASPVLADDGDDQLARTLIDRFYDDLGPNSAELEAFMGEGFQIIGSDGLSFDKKTYPGFAKEVTSYEIEDLVTRRDGDVLSATYNVTYAGAFEGVAREVPRLARLAVFQEIGGEWKIQALAALGTGENDVGAVAPGVVAQWLAATSSGEAGRIRGFAAPDFQRQEADGKGVSLEAWVSRGFAAEASPAVENLIATSFSNTMVVRYNLRFSSAPGRVEPRLTVFQRINGEWKVAGEAVFAAIDG